MRHLDYTICRLMRYLDYTICRLMRREFANRMQSVRWSISQLFLAYSIYPMGVCLSSKIYIYWSHWQELFGWCSIPHVAGEINLFESRIPTFV